MNTMRIYSAREVDEISRRVREQEKDSLLLYMIAASIVGGASMLGILWAIGKVWPQ